MTSGLKKWHDPGDSTERAAGNSVISTDVVALRARRVVARR
jgi:hypothetical protein